MGNDMIGSPVAPWCGCSGRVLEAGGQRGRLSRRFKGEVMVPKTREVTIGTPWEMTGPREHTEPWSSTEHRNVQDSSHLA